ncbi:MAG: ABC transporter substrate-binding protein [Spiribacter sp.]|nr:ABC transporter substrate-binding protein [Spiribacter sp.]
MESVDRRRRRLMQGLGVAGAATATGTWPMFGQAQTPSRGGMVRIAAPIADNLEPVTMTGSGTIAIVQQVAEYLVWAEDDLSLRPVLATEWYPEDNARIWHFKLREGVMFQDGREMTSADVVASFQRMVEPDSGSSGAAQLDFLKPDNVTAEGRYAVRFELDRPVGAFPYYTHVYNAVILPADYSGDFANNPVGTGPFRLVDYRPQEGARLERNPDYWDNPLPYLDAVELDFYDGSQPQVLAMQGGEADAMLSAGYIDIRPLFEADDIRMVAQPTSTHAQVTMRTDQKPFDDVRVRQAVALAVDRPRAIEVLLGGNASMGNDHPLAPIYPSEVNITQRERDLNRARSLLTDAGYPNGFPIDLHVGRLAELSQYGEMLQQMLAEIGIEVDLKIEPLNVYYDHWTEVTFGVTDWASRATPGQFLNAAFRGGADWNAPKWANDRFDDVLDQFESEADETRRAALGEELASILNEEVPAVISYFKDGFRPVNKRVRDLPGNMSNFLDLTHTWVT